MSRFQQFIIGMVLVIVGVNIMGSGVVNYLTWQKVAKLEQQTSQLTDQIAKQVVAEEPVTSPQETKPQSTTTPSLYVPDTSKVDQTAFDFIVESLQLKVSNLEKRVFNLESKPSTTTSTQTQTVVKSSSPIKEQTVFIGSGSSSSTEWTDISTTSIELNSGNYPNVHKVLFEATMSIVGGEARARLKNKTTGGIIYPSEVKHNSSVAATVLSGSFTLAEGSNQYIVQLRSSSNETVMLDGARLRLFYE